MGREDFGACGLRSLGIHAVTIAVHGGQRRHKTPGVWGVLERYLH